MDNPAGVCYVYVGEDTSPTLVARAVKRLAEMRIDTVISDPRLTVKQRAYKILGCDRILTVGVHRNGEADRQPVTDLRLALICGLRWQTYGELMTEDTREAANSDN